MSKILQKFQSLLAPPVFSGDAEKTRIAALLQTNLLTCSLAMLLLVFGGLIGGIIRFSGIVVASIALMFVLALQIPLRLGAVRQASLLLVAIITASVAGFICSSGTIRAPGGAIYLVLASLLAGLLINRKAALISAIINCLLIFSLLAAELNKLLPAPIVSVGLAQAVAFAVGALWTVVLVNQATRSVDESLALAQRELSERQRADERAKYRSEILEKVVQLGKTVSEVTDFRTTLLRIWQSVRNELDFDRMAIFLYNPAENAMHGTYGTDRNGNLSEIWDLKFTLKPDDPFFQLLSHPDGFHLTHDFQGELSHAPNERMTDIKEHVSGAVWAGDKPVAIITADQLLTQRPILEEQLEALRLFSGYAGLAIEKSRLNERERSRQTMLETVIHLGKVVTEEANYRTALLRIFNSVRDNLGFDRCGLFVYDPKRETMCGSFGTDRQGNRIEEWGLEVPLNSSSFFGTLISIPDGYFFTTDYDHALNVPANDMMSGVKYYAAVSAWKNDQPVAILCVDQLISGREITEEQLEALRLFAGYAGLAIENARLKSELEQRVRERTAELEAANRELESFSYSVSHDLRAPLRVINGFSKILNDDFSIELSPPVQGFLKKIRDSGIKMGNLIEALLSLSRLGRKPLMFQLVDMNALVQSTLDTLALEISDRSIEWVLAELPPVNADPFLIQQVYANLIGNAIKYSRWRERARIEIGSLNQNGEVVYYVRDNGAGFDMQFADHLFGVFQRLHSDDEFEGTGIGLATVQRIVQRHGGRVWAEAEVDQGATFYFTLAPGLHQVMG